MPGTVASFACRALQCKRPLLSRGCRHARGQLQAEVLRYDACTALGTAKAHLRRTLRKCGEIRAYYKVAVARNLQPEPSVNICSRGIAGSRQCVRSRYRNPRQRRSCGRSIRSDPPLNHSALLS
jgi:hypothetical protein